MVDLMVSYGSLDLWQVRPPNYVAKPKRRVTTRHNPDYIPLCLLGQERALLADSHILHIIFYLSLSFIDGFINLSTKSNTSSKSTTDKIWSIASVWVIAFASYGSLKLD